MTDPTCVLNGINAAGVVAIMKAQLFLRRDVKANQNVKTRWRQHTPISVYNKTLQKPRVIIKLQATAV